MTVQTLVTRLTARDQNSTTKDVFSAAVLLALGVALLATGVHAFSEFPVLLPVSPEALHWWHSAPLVLACIATGFQTRYPLGVFFVITSCLMLDMALGLHLAVLIPWANTVYNAGRYTSGALLRWFLLGFNVLVFLWVYAFSGDANSALNGLLQVALTSLIAIWWGTEVRRGDQQTEAERLKSLAARRREEHERQELLRRQRADLATQLHDTISSHLSSIALYTAGTLDAPREPARDTNVLTEIRHASLAAMTDMRELIDVLRTFVTDDDRPLSPEPLNVSQIFQRLRSAGLTISITDDLTDQLHKTVKDMDPTAGRSVAHVLQEALTNALKHGDGTATLHCENTKGWLSITVGNPITSAQPASVSAPGESTQLSGGLGLGAMAAAVHNAGGFFAAGTTRKAGASIWEVHLEVPTSAQQHPDHGHTAAAQRSDR